VLDMRLIIGGLPLISISLLVLGSSAGGAPASAPTPPLPGLVDVTTLDPRIRVELTYATPHNFMKRNVYGALRRCFLRPEAARMLAVASSELRKLRPELSLLVYDCVRPLRVQRIMWKIVEGTPGQRYVADPRRGSMHNLGVAVDLSLADRAGKALDMGGRFDLSGATAEPRLELSRRKAGTLSSEQWANRLLLRMVMVRAGFIPLVNEWWHFDAELVPAARRRYQLVP
jgi:D-alanyl-D-alanine dipeptidase